MVKNYVEVMAFSPKMLTYHCTPVLRLHCYEHVNMHFIVNMPIHIKKCSSFSCGPKISCGFHCLKNVAKRLFKSHDE